MKLRKLKKYIGYEFYSKNVETVYYLAKSGRMIYYKGYCDTKSLHLDNIVKTSGYHKNWQHTRFHIN